MKAASVAAPLLSAALLLTSSATGAVETSSRPRPDGLIVFDGRESGGLSTIRPDGSALRSVRGTVGDAEPAWSPDGRMLAVARSDGIWLRAVDGSHARRLTRRHPQGFDASPSWSPDGTQIVFVRGTAEERRGGYRLGLWKVSAEGGRPRPVLVEPSGANPDWSLGNPDWSPDGRRVAFSFGLERLTVIRADGTNRRWLGPPALRGREPHWSPDGRRVAFLEFREDGPQRFRILYLATGRVRTMFESDGEVHLQSWSPDGRWLAILATRRVECETVVLDDYCERLDLWTVDAFNARRTLIHSFGQDGTNALGMDWRRSR